MTTRSRPVVGRLAPSPTGAQHIGNARTYLIAWLSVRSRGGRVILRIEDIDSPRLKAGAAEQACADLRWLGLDWDAGPIRQTERMPRYAAALQDLQTRELIYPCTCSRNDVEQAASAPHGEHEGSAYPGTCAQRRAADAAGLGGRTFSWRFRARGRIPEFMDRYRGRTTLARPELGGDFVVWKCADTAAYQLAVVVDDAEMEITEVVRGDDLVPSTPRQLLLYEALRLPIPEFVHVPMVVGPDGRRLAKRHGDTRLSSLRAAAVEPEALLGVLAWSCGWNQTKAPVRARDLIGRFDLAGIPSRPLVVDADLLRTIGYANAGQEA
jgi:glutamyl-tRNA synthetase